MLIRWQCEFSPVRGFLPTKWSRHWRYSLAFRQFENSWLGNVRHGFKVKTDQILEDGELRRLNGAFHTPGIALGHFGGAKREQVPFIRQIPPCGVLGIGLVVLEKRREVQLLEICFQQCLMLHVLILYQDCLSSRS